MLTKIIPLITINSTYEECQNKYDQFLYVQIFKNYLYVQ